MASRSRSRFALCCAVMPSVANAGCVAKTLEVGSHVDQALRIGKRHVDRAARLVAACERPGRATQPGSDTASIHPDLDVVRAVAVPEDEHLSVARKALAATAVPRRGTRARGTAHRPDTSAADEIVRRRVAQIDDRVRHRAANVDEPRGACRRRNRRRAADAVHVISRQMRHSAANVQPAPRHPGVASLAARSLTWTYASAKLRVTAGSTGMPGPVVVETTTFFR